MSPTRERQICTVFYGALPDLPGPELCNKPRLALTSNCQLLGSQA